MPDTIDDLYAMLVVRVIIGLYGIRLLNKAAVKKGIGKGYERKRFTAFRVKRAILIIQS